MFVGREAELLELQRRYELGTFQMAVVYGRRRVGKTTLLAEFAKDKRTLFFTALEQSDEDNLKDFGSVIARFFGLPEGTGFSSWSAAIDYLADRADSERFLLIFDEFPYAVRRNDSLPSIFQVAIDHRLKETSLFLVLCGSNQGLMESQVLGRKSPLYGRRTLQMRLRPLGFRDAAKMLPSLDPQEAFRYYGCFGGVPYYLGLVDQGLTLRENLARLYFDRMGFLYDEPMGLLRQELSEPALYGSTLRAIAGGANRVSAISDRTGIPATTLPRYLATLEGLGIIERAVPFGESRLRSKRGIYRVSDACYDFWFRFVAPAASSVEAGLGEVLALRLPEARIDEYLGHRFESLCAEWVVLAAAEGKLPVAVTSVGSWWGTNPAKRAQDDIDLVAADDLEKRLLLGECKYRGGFDESAELDDLLAKASLIKGYESSAFYLFTKGAVSPGTAARCERDERLGVVTLDEMYER